MFFDNIMEIYLIVVPKFDVNTLESILEGEQIFLEIIKKIQPFLSDPSMDTSEMIKYRGLRKFDSNFIKNNKSKL